VLEEAGLVDLDKSPEGMRPIAGAEIEKNKGQTVDKEKDKVERGKIRRSLHRTLREAHVPTHNRSRKGKDSSSSAAVFDEVTDDVLARGTGSFVVHGKKASVIHFGSELSEMSPDERLRLRKQPHKEAGPLSSPATIDDDFHSILAEPFEYHERHESTATQSTTTAMSFRDLHKHLLVPGANGPTVTMSEENDSEAAVSFSEGRRTPLPPVEDEDEEDEDHLGLNSPSSRQAMFYTPEASNSPTFPTFRDDHPHLDEEGEMDDSEPESPERERLPSPPVQVVSA